QPGAGEVYTAVDAGKRDLGGDGQVRGDDGRPEGRGGRGGQGVPPAHHGRARRVARPRGRAPGTRRRAPRAQDEPGRAAGRADGRPESSGGRRGWRTPSPERTRSSRRRRRPASTPRRSGGTSNRQGPLHLAGTMRPRNVS